MSNKNQQNLGDDIEDFDFIFSQYGENNSTFNNVSAKANVQSPANTNLNNYMASTGPLKRPEKNTAPQERNNTPSGGLSANTNLADYMEAVGPLKRPEKNSASQERNNTPSGSLAVNNVNAKNSNAKSTKQNSSNTKAANYEKAIEYFNAGIDAFEKEDAEACIKYFVAAAKLEEPSAMYNLGVIYHNGALNITQDIGVAIQWYKLAKSYGNEKASEVLVELEEAYPKYFGLGRVISILLHIPMVIAAAILSVILVCVQYFAVPGLLLFFKGNCYFFKLSQNTSFMIAGIWSILALLIIFYHTYKDKLFFYKRALGIVEFLVNLGGHLLNFILSLACSGVVCVAQYFGVKHYLTQNPSLIPHPFWTKVALWAPLAITGIVVFVICICIFSCIKDKVNEYY